MEVAGRFGGGVDVGCFLVNFRVFLNISAI